MNQLSKLAAPIQPQQPMAQAMQPQQAMPANALSQAAQPQKTMAEQVSKSSDSGHYNGTVKFEGGKVDVVDGVADVNGHVFYVSQNGQMVVDQNRRFIGTIQNGKFVVATPEIIDQFRKQGLFENEQPQGMAAQAPG